MKALRILMIALAGSLSHTALALTLSQQPLFIAATEPRVMLVASRDHQLSIKAYTDYSDLNGDGVLDTTYNDNIAYYGYFDSNKCYSYTSNRFEPSAAVTSGTHQCSGGTYWSGNFMNWASMTRMDILRKTLYGGYRSTDSTTETVLERHFLPVDVHAFVKVYNPGSNATLKLYIPSTVVGASNTSISLCNVSDSTDTDLTGTSSFTMPAPLIKVAAGSWPQWASSEVNECAVNSGYSTQPTSLIGSAYNARVQVCSSTGGTESNCKTYTHPTTAAQTVKPTGLLQKYGDVDVDRRVRFGLMTGSYTKNKSGGVLRKNTGFIANNSGTSVTSSSVCGDNNSSDEIDVCTGQFINQGTTDAGIINTFNRLRIAGFKYTSSGGNDAHRYSCNSPGLLTFANGECVDWGSPLSELYLETLRYFSNAGVSSAFNTNDATVLASLPQLTWSDPLPSTEWCALSNIVVLSTGLNSFDTDELTSFTPTGGSAVNAATLTQTVGDSSHENINGNTYLIGDNGSTANNQCTAKSIGNLATAKGICPEVPSTQGGYGIAGLAYAPKTLDLRPGYSTQRAARWGGTTPINPAWAARQPLNTYAVQLAESLPRFSVTVGTGSVTLLPACQANSSGSTSAWTTSSTGWRNCSMTDLIVDTNVAQASVGSSISNTCSGNGTTSQCFTIPWEDSTWGNDYDMDGIQRLGYCVGSACSTFKMLCPTTASATATIGPFSGIGTSEIVIASCTAQAQAGHALTFGYTLTGTTADGAYYPILRPGGANFNAGSALASGITAPSSTVTTVSSYPSSSFPVTAKFTQGTSSGQLLKNPLWYAAKYGGFTDTNNNQNPDLTAEWDAVNNTTGAAGADGLPDNYFDVKNPANLITALSAIFDAASQPDAAASSVATNSTNLQIESRVFQAKFSSADWSGQLLSYRINSTTGALVPTAEWDAGVKLKAGNFTPSSRVILTMGASDGVAFQWGNLTTTTSTGQQALLNLNAAGTNDGLGSSRVSYLRGDAGNEGTGATNFRVRADSKLGDIINSSPWYVGEPKAGFSDVDHPGYSTFRTTYKNRLPVVYVAGNDGMLHGFDASLDFTVSGAPQGQPTTHSGNEVLAYVPSAVYSNLSRLTDQKYNRNHRYFVDGSPMVGDVDLDSTTTNNWRTVLIGGLGAGGKGYYALDITNPGIVNSAGTITTVGNISESGSAPADTLLWEFDETDMGNAYNMPPAHAKTNQAKQIVKMANGKWAAIVGNGYNSASGKAVLYILFIEDGINGWGSGDYVKIVADTGSGNGLSTPVPIDTDGDGIVDTVYAGDLKGRMWKFLVGPNLVDNTVTATPSTWKIALSTAGCTNNCTPLFDAGTTKPITWPAEVTLHPNGGQMVLFGTGKYLESTDNASANTQTIYGVWDNNAAVASANLVQQTVTSVVTTAAGNFRTTSTNSVNYAGTDRGWYLDLPTSGERMTGVPKLDSGIVYFNTFIPSTSPCDAGGTGFFMGLDYLTGKMPTQKLFDTDNNGTIDSSDTTVSGFQIGAALGGTTLIWSTVPGSLSVGVSSLTSGAMSTTLLNLGVGTRGRISWREIVQ